MAEKMTNWYRNDLPDKEKKLEQAEREYKVASLALAKAEAELEYQKAQCEHFRIMADLTDEENEQMEEQRQRWAKEAKPLLKVA